MRIKRKKILWLLVFFIIIFFINLVLSKSNREALRGEIVVWTEDTYYSYFTKIANEFEKSNKKVNINVINISEEDYLDNIMSSDYRDLPNVVQLNFAEMNKVKDKIDFTEENKDIIETYKKNFNESRLKEVQINENYYAVPFTSNPIALYLREDILKEYGYESEGINTWKQLISIGKEINIKTNGEITIFSSKDKENISLLILSQLVDDESKEYSKEDIINEIKNIYNENYVTDSDNYLCRVDSLDFYKEIVNKGVQYLWGCKNPPSFNVGENKLFDLGGENLVALKIGKSEEAIKEFIAFTATNRELLSEELLKGNFFPSSLYSLKVTYNKESRSSLGNSEENSPFLILSNIVERAPSIKNYDKFEEIVFELYDN
jgi:multiple sugar transport system substrate-binding protein